ncbi:MAG: tRNA (adenosine(37)-N6)-threonylcarbamoyltransferase complex transferase subunit TsaD, partial [Saprospiraceae bacterium]
DFSFSGFKTAVLYFLRNQTAADPNFIQQNLPDLCASIQETIVQILIKKLRKAAAQTGVRHIAIAGGVSANAGLRRALETAGQKAGWTTYLTAFQYCTDNAAMIGMAAWFKYQKGQFIGQDAEPYARSEK